MSETDRPAFVAFYKDRPAHTLTHEELLAAYTHVCRVYTEMREFQLRSDELQRLLDSVWRL